MFIFLLCCRQSPAVKDEWKYARGGRDLVTPLVPRPMYYAGNFVPPGAAMYPATDPFQRERFAPWRSVERDYRRDYDRRQQ